MYHFIFYTILYHKIFIKVCYNESFKICMTNLYVAFLYNTVDVEYFYKTSGNIFFSMTHIHCKSIANEHTLLNGKHDSSEILNTIDYTQLG
jgi:hypothetical protein